MWQGSGKTTRGSPGGDGNYFRSLNQGSDLRGRTSNFLSGFQLRETCEVSLFSAASNLFDLGDCKWLVFLDGLNIGGSQVASVANQSCVSSSVLFTAAAFANEIRVHAVCASSDALLDEVSMSLNATAVLVPASIPLLAADREANGTRVTIRRDWEQQSCSALRRATIPPHL